MSKVCVIGLDGGTFRVIDHLVDQGRLPNFQRLLSHGSRGDLESTMPPLTPAAWASFYTGTNPGKHGVVDFFERVEGTYRLSPVNAHTVRGATLWSLAGDNGRRVCVYNVPITYPAKPVNGILISGMDSPRLDEQAFYPGEYMAGLLEAVPDFRINPLVDARYLVNNHPEPVREYIRIIDAHLQVELNTMRQLMREEDWDLFIGVIRSTDIFQHMFWHDAEAVMDSGAAGVAPETAERAEAVFRCYETIDRELGEHWFEWCADRDLVIMSDHGFGELSREVCVNRILAGAGLLHFRRKGSRRKMKEAIMQKARTALPPSLRQKIKRAVRQDDKAGRAGLLFVDALVSDIDWERTSIYSRGQFGCLYLNRVGREPDGIVVGEEKADDVLRRAEEALTAYVDPADGEPVVTACVRGDDLYEGPMRDEMPDMVISMRDYRYRGIYSTMVELAGEEIVRLPHPEHKQLAQTGNHRRNGILMLHGPDIGHADLATRGMTDVAPTVLQLMGLPVAREMDGEVITAALDPAVAGGTVYSDAATGTYDSGDRGTDVYSQEDEEAVRRNLEDLGYL